MDKFEFGNQFGEYLKELRGKRSLREIARLSGISNVQLSNLEKGVDPRTGKRAEPSIETLKKLAIAFDITLEEMMSKAYIKTFTITPEEAKQLMEEENELRKNKDILFQLKNRESNVYLNGHQMNNDDRQRMSVLLKAAFPEYFD